MQFNEDSRVKIPAILHLMRLGYSYLSLKEHVPDRDTNIFPMLFAKAIARINPQLAGDDIGRLLEDTKLLLDNDDLGQAFWGKLLQRSGPRLIDFENFDNNSFHVVTELPYVNGDEEFRPDITLLVNGMPLVFIEVKKPNNRDGILAERSRINTRFKNPKFKRFVNITQFMLFSNNMEYDDDDSEPLQGAFYASPSYSEPKFNYFREEEQPQVGAFITDVTDAEQRRVLHDTNLEAIHASPEFQTNKQADRPTNRLCTSLLSRERLAFILQYALAYVAEEDGVQKHIMRYPQLFATRAIARTLDADTTKGIIWHTQGSGKTALAYYNVHFLTDYFQQRGTIPKFYFIVDRLDLLNQARSEFTSRGLVVHTVNSREDFVRDIKTPQVIHNDQGKREITVVNIQKFRDDPTVVAAQDYDLSIQRVYFLDEVHRSYNPEGSFLANLNQSDRNAIKIGLTGTPLLGDDYNSRSLFGDYIHKYYYDASIRDGYTLRLIREAIATQYRMELEQTLAAIEVQMGDVDKRQLYAHPRYVEPMLDYIVKDFAGSRAALGDASIGGMVICDSADQAREMYRIFDAAYTQHSSRFAEMGDFELYEQAPPISYAYTEQRKRQNSVKRTALILHDEGTKQERKDKVRAFKAGKIDLLFVYNMLLTGFDAPRLKKLYLGRKIKAHNLLQALTRVNRTYNGLRYGYVVDFADISAEFEKTNTQYLDELRAEYGDEADYYANLFKSEADIQTEIADIKAALFEFNLDNAEIFSDQISQIKDREQLLELKKALAGTKSLYNVIRLQGQYELLKALDFTQLARLYRETENHLALLNRHAAMQTGDTTQKLLNQALEDTLFLFTKVGEQELVLAGRLKDKLRQTRETLAGNFDKADPKFIALKEELERLFKKQKLDAVTHEDMTANISSLEAIRERAEQLNQQNERVAHKYGDDSKYARIHKRLCAQPDFTGKKDQLHAALSAIKTDTDGRLLDSNALLGNEDYFSKLTMPLLIRHFRDEQLPVTDKQTAERINQLLVREYMAAYNTGATQW